MGVQPLEGIRVLDLSNHITGAYCTKQFADYGAEVTKVEKPSRGCLTRHLPPFAGDDPHPDKGLAFLYLNTNKKSITLNLKTLTGQKILVGSGQKYRYPGREFCPRHNGVMGYGF